MPMSITLSVVYWSKYDAGISHCKKGQSAGILMQKLCIFIYIKNCFTHLLLFKLHSCMSLCVCVSGLPV